MNNKTNQYLSRYRLTQIPPSMMALIRVTTVHSKLMMLNHLTPL